MFPTLFGRNVYAKTNFLEIYSLAVKENENNPKRLQKVQPDLGVSLSGVEKICRRYLEDNMNADFSEDGFNNLLQNIF